MRVATQQRGPWAGGSSPHPDAGRAWGQALEPVSLSRPPPCAQPQIHPVAVTRAALLR